MSKKKKRRIIGVDPGTNIMGYAIIDILGSSIKLQQMGVLKNKGLSTHHEKLIAIYKKIDSLVSHYKPHSLSIEAPFYGKNPQSMLKLGRAQGVAITAAMQHGIEVTEYSPKKIKLAITGNGNASKEQLSSMLPNLIDMNEIETKYLDATDALAAALCHYFQNNSILGNSKQYSGWSDFIKNNPNKVK
jgi:crossover junction endodeoxyribonuclease RuvC